MLGEVRGHVHAGFEAVRELLQREQGLLADGGGAFAVFADGECIINLYAGEARPGVPWDAETLPILFSATKGLTTLCAQVLTHQGRLDINRRVADYWPRFEKGGKDKILVRHILSHTSGVVEVPGYQELFHWDGRGFDQREEIARRLEGASPLWEPGARHGYHATTYGWLVGRLVELITGKSLGEFFAEAVAGPLGLALRIGTPSILHSRIPFFTDSSTARPADPERARIWDTCHDPTTVSGRAFLAMPDGNAFDHMASLMNNPMIQATEVGAGNATGTAYDLARMYAWLACGGVLEGKPLLSAQIIREWAREQASGVDAVSLIPWRWTLGYHLQSAALTAGGKRPGPFGPNLDTAFGHVGYGGQSGGSDCNRRLSFAFLRNHLVDNFKLPGLLLSAVYQHL